MAKHETSYWNNNGKHQAVIDQLQAMIPDEGRVKNPTKNKALERFRVACNHYYRLYNDGDFNVGSRKLFGVKTVTEHKEYKFTSHGRRYSNWKQSLYDVVNESMDKIIEAACAEQNIPLTE